MSKWRDNYNDRERLQILACEEYYSKFKDAGLPGHNLMLLIASMARLLDNAEQQQQGGTDVPFFAHDTLPIPQYGNQVTEKQLKAIYAIGAAAKRLSEPQVDDRCAEIFGVKPSELTKAEASQFIDMLKGMQ